MLKLYEESCVQDIADAIRNKNGTANTYNIRNMAGAINNIQSGSSGGTGLPDTIIAGDTPIIVSNVMVKTIGGSDITATGIKIVVPKTGAYRFKFACGRTNLTGDWTTQLYKNGVAIIGAVSTWSSYEGYCIADVPCTSGDEIGIYAKSRSANYYRNINIISQLVACIDWNIFN